MERTPGTFSLFLCLRKKPTNFSLRTAQHRFAVPSTHMRIWFASGLQTIWRARVYEAYELSSCDITVIHKYTLSHDQAYLGNVVSIYTPWVHITMIRPYYAEKRKKLTCKLLLRRTYWRFVTLNHKNVRLGTNKLFGRRKKGTGKGTMSYFKNFKLGLDHTPVRSDERWRSVCDQPNHTFMRSRAHLNDHRGMCKTIYFREISAYFAELSRVYEFSPNARLVLTSCDRDWF